MYHLAPDFLTEEQIADIVSVGDESPLQDGLVHPSPRKGIGPPFVDKSMYKLHL